MFFLSSLIVLVSKNFSSCDDDTDPFAFSSKDYKSPQAKRKNALVPSTRICNLKSKKDHNYPGFRADSQVQTTQNNILLSKLRSF